MPKWLGIKVPKHQAESLRKLLVSRSLIDPRFKAFCNCDFVHFPLRAQIPSDLDLSPLNSQLGEYEFQPSTKLDYSELGFQPRYELVGQIAILEREYDLQTASRIGRYLVSRFKQIKSVVLPLTNIETEYRIRKYVVVAGTDSLLTLHRENKLSFLVDLSKAYFNPKLAQERLRVSSQIQLHETVLDMFAGVGGFTIYAAKRASKVIAVDLNPEAIKLLRLNLKLNRVENVEVHCGDIREFRGKLGSLDRIIMDLPLAASDYLELALEFAKSGGIIHYYTVSKPDQISGLISELESRFGLSCLGCYRIGSYAPSIQKYALDLLK